MRRNTNTQYYKGVPLRLINNKKYRARYSKKFAINGTGYSVCIPSAFLDKTGTIKSDADLDWMFRNRIIRTRLISAGIDKNIACQHNCHKVSRAII